ncbi:MAG TPA: hypothetical protein VFH69_05560 [Gemmatimonadota bacterium]|nr:hypothetical protein [Gemmatimonadota bacterium]
MIDARYLAALLALAGLVAAVAWPWIDRWPGGREGLLAGLAFSLVSLGAGYHALRWGARRGDTKLFGALVGATLARLVGIALLGIVLSRSSLANLEVTLLTVVVLHFVLGTFEILYLKRSDALG